MDHWDKLKSALEKEIRLLREILANMHQEEAAILIGDQGSREITLQMRAHMFLRLNDLRLARLSTVEQIEKTMQKKLEELLSLFQVEALEVVSLHGQLATLMEKLNSQDHRNHLLANQSSQHEFPFFQLPTPEKKKKKSSI